MKNKDLPLPLEYLMRKYPALRAIMNLDTASGEDRQKIYTDIVSLVRDLDFQITQRLNNVNQEGQDE